MTTTKTETPLTCSICQGEIDAQGTWLRGHNAQPVNNGRCCTDCNTMVVIPARLNLMKNYRATQTKGD